MKPRLCVTVTAPTMAELRRRRDEVADADLVELRLDSVRDPDVAGALEGRRRPVIVTCRPKWEHGGFSGAEEERRRILGAALEQGAEYVDVEWRARFTDLIDSTAGRRVVVSVHEFDGVPSDLAGRVQAMRSVGAEVVKVAVRTNSLTDCVTLFDLGAQSGGRGDLVLVGMGEQGLATRVLAQRFGSAWTYAGSDTDIGQLSPQSILEDFRFRSLTDATRLFGIVGRPVAHSVSPAMHNAAFKAARLDAIYLPFPATDAADFVRFAEAIGLEGASVTTPFKVPLFERVDEADSTSRRVGALNTIRVVDGRWMGANTDAGGFLKPLGERFLGKGVRVSILGAGGAARAVAIALAAKEADVTIHARNAERAKEVALIGSARVGPWPPAAGTWDMLVNCTPVGTHPAVEATPLDAGHLTGRVVYDLVYNPPVTRLMRDAAAAGLQTIGGLEMLVAQAQEQSYWWTGVRPAGAVMREAALKQLAGYPDRSAGD